MCIISTSMPIRLKNFVRRRVYTDRQEDQDFRNLGREELNGGQSSQPKIDLSGGARYVLSLRMT